MPRANPVKTCPGCDDAALRRTLTIEQQCARCRNYERNRLWREANPSAMAENAKRWREAGNRTVRPEGYAEAQRVRERERYRSDPATRAAIKASNERRRLEKPDEVKEAVRRWQKANPDKRREYHLKQLAKLGVEGRRARGKELRHRYRVQRQAGSAAYYARRYGGTGIVTNEHLYALHKWQDHCCFYCRRPLNAEETIEHIVPLSRNGSNNPWNVVLACVSCNSAKSDRIFGLEWTPDDTASSPRIHSLFGTSELKRLLDGNGIACAMDGDHLDINGRPVFILSSFWLGWQGDEHIKALKARYPTAIVFFDKEFVRRPQAIVNVLKAKAGIAERIGARKLILAEPTVQEAQAFIGTWHAMGATNGTHYLGLRDADQWWIVAAFRRDIDRYEIVRMAIRETVAGGVSRVVGRFREIMPEKGWPIVAFTDQRMGDGKSHFFAGFEADGATERSFFYATPEVDGFHPRRDFQKQVLEVKAEFFDPAVTQMANAKANGLMRVEGLPRLRFTLSATP